MRAPFGFFCFIVILSIQTANLSAQKNTDAPLSTEELAQLELDELLNLNLEISLGTRVKGKRAFESASPIDVITYQQLIQTGQNELGKALRDLLPAFNFSSTTISDGSDIIRPATLRGLAPDQLLLLINGKRRHQQALVHVQETIGKGSAGYDINSIPMSAVDYIEVLRDGAAAQYGSDAIAGVINIVLRENTDSTIAQIYYGETSEGDGSTHSISLNSGFGSDWGWLNLTLEKRERAKINRAGVAELPTTGGFLIGDWRNADGSSTRRLVIGEAESDNQYIWVNSAINLEGSHQLYFIATHSEREGQSYGFFRGSGSERVIPSIYPGGFLPKLVTDIEDSSYALGIKGAINEAWSYDITLQEGRSDFRFGSENSANISWFYEPINGGIYAETPQETYNGSLISRQEIIDFDISGSLILESLDNPLNLSFGGEVRKDGYQIKQGEPASWSFGRSDDPLVTITNIDNGGSAPPGIQGFPGFKPSTEVNDDRESLGLYLDAENQLTDALLLGIALRYEDYEFAGSNTTGKFSMRYAHTEALAYRGTISTGFRAPAAQQIYYSQVSTTLVGGDLIESGTIANNSNVAREFGIDGLEEETSESFSLGLVAQPDKHFMITADIYQVEIDDRIILSDPVTGVTPAIQAILNANGLGAAQFFTNAVDTKTQGIDLVFSYLWQFDDSSLQVKGAIDHYKTKVTSLQSTSQLIPSTSLVTDTQILRLERGEPSTKMSLSGSYSSGSWESQLMLNYFGKVSGSAYSGLKNTWGSKWITNISADYSFSDSMKLSLGVNNLFDVYPDKWGTEGSVLAEAGFTYGWETLPFGLGGRYIYSRLNINF